MSKAAEDIDSDIQFLKGLAETLTEVTPEEEKNHDNTF